MLAFALGRLRWCPDAVWRATPREIASALGHRAGETAMARTRLDELMSRFPDCG